MIHLLSKNSAARAKFSFVLRRKATVYLLTSIITLYELKPLLTTLTILLAFLSPGYLFSFAFNMYIIL